MMKKKKGKICADNGYPVDPNLYPQYIYDQTWRTPMQPGVTGSNLPSPMPIQGQSNSGVKQNTQPSSPDMMKGSIQLPGSGDMIAAISQVAAQLVPEHIDKKKYSPYIKPVYNQYSQGTGSQAINKYGGETQGMPTFGDGGYTTNTRRHHNIEITEEVPTYMPPQEQGVATPANRDYLNTLKINAPKMISLTPSYTNIDKGERRLWDYVPEFSGMNHYEALQAAQELPRYIGDIPVERSQYQLAQDYQNFRPGTEGDWRLNGMEMGGEITPIADSGIHINPKNKGKFNALKKRTGKTTEQLTHSKNPLTRKRAIFAQNAKKWHHGEDGLSVGQELDLTPDQIAHYKSLGYEFED